MTGGSTGNNSASTTDGGVWVSPTGTSFGRLDPARLRRIDPNGSLLDGDPAFKEMPLHSAFYEARSKVGAVAHSSQIWLVSFLTYSHWSFAAPQKTVKMGSKQTLAPVIQKSFRVAPITCGLPGSSRQLSRIGRVVIKGDAKWLQLSHHTNVGYAGLSCR